MELKCIQIGFDPKTGEFDDAVLQEYMTSRHLREYTPYFYQYEGQPRLCLIVCSQVIEPGGSSRPGKSMISGKRQASIEEEIKLCPQDSKTYERLKAWRNTRAKAEGVPPFVILKNSHLRQIVQIAPRSKEQLLEIHGIGEKKWQNWGGELLEVLHEKPG